MSQIEMGDAGGSYEHENENGDAIRNEDARDENSIVKILRSFDLTEKVIQRIRDSDIRPSDLSALCDEDLKLFGIEHAETRNECLNQFKAFKQQIQTNHFTKYLAEMNIDEYQKSVYKNIENQLIAMNKVLELSQLVLQSNSIKYDKLIDDNMYVSSLNFKAINEILKTISRITNQNKSSESKRSYIWLYSAAVVTLVSSFAAIKIIRR